MTTITHLDDEPQTPCSLHSKDPNPVATELERRKAARHRDLDQRLIGAAPSEAALLIDEVEALDGDDFIDLYDPSTSDPCPRCGVLLPRGYPRAVVPTVAPRRGTPEQIGVTIRPILARGNRCPAECLNMARSLSVTAIPGNDRFANLLIFSVAGTPPHGVACVSTTHDGSPFNCFVGTGVTLSQEEVDTLRLCACMLADVSDYHIIPSDLRVVIPAKAVTA